MDLELQAYQAFIIRIWLEENSVEVREAPLRGTVTHVNSRKNKTFDDFHKVFEFISEHLFEEWAIKPRIDAVTVDQEDLEMSMDAQTGIGRTGSSLWELLSDQWENVYEKELGLIEIDRPMFVAFTTNEITTEKKYLDQWQPVPTVDELEDEFPQLEIGKAEMWLNDQKNSWVTSKQQQTEALTAKKAEVDSQKQTVQEKETALKELLDELKALPTQQSAADAEVTDLKKQLAEAEEQWRKDLIQAELAMAENKLAYWSSLGPKLNDAITQAFAAWLRAREELLRLNVEKEDIDVAIKKLDAKIGYVNARGNALVKAYLNLPAAAPASPTQSAEAVVVE